MSSVIDQHVDARVAQQGWPVAGTASDAEFLRRATLDLTGTIPPPDEVRAFLSDDDPRKRTKLVDQLLASDAHARHMAIVFDVFLMERRPDKYVNTVEWRSYLAAAFAENRPLDEFVGEILGADGVDPERRPAAKFFLDRAVDKDALVRDIGRLLLGVNLQCAQCHDHPDIDDYRHRHYHGLAVFVAGSKTFKQPDGTFVLQESVLREVEFASVFDPETTNRTGPRLIEALLEVPEFPEGEEYVEKPARNVRSVPKFSLRTLLAERLPSDETPEFSRNMANRLWAMLMGRGLVHPLDMHHTANPPSHPELIDALAARLRETDYDVRDLLRGIALSEAYGRSSLAPEGVDPDTLPLDSYAVANAKGLSPEQLFESVLVATDAESVLKSQIDKAIAEAATESDGEDETPDEEAIAAARTAERAKRVGEFVAVFGGAAGQPQETFTASLPQALFLANSPTVAAWVTAGSKNLTARLIDTKDAEAVAEELFLAVHARLPDDDERTFVKKYLDEADDRSAAITLLVWSRLTSAEFRLNH